MSEVLSNDLFGQSSIRRAAHVRGDCRFTLTRDWGAGPRACVIGHNPSTADASIEDPTTRWLNRWFQLFGFGGYTIVNLYPWRSSDPADIYKRVDGIDGGDWSARDELYYANHTAIIREVKRASQVFVCWGGIARQCNWLDYVVEEIQQGDEPWPDLWCWGKTASGAPKHPMARGVHRIATDQKPILWLAGHG